MKNHIDLKKLRNQKGYTQEQAAKFLKCTREHYQRIELGKLKPSVQLAKEIGLLLGFDWTLIFKD